MRICYLANASSSHVERWMQFFVDQGHDVHIISFEEPRVTLDGVTIHYVPTRKKLIIPFTFYLKVRQFRKIVEQIGPDVVHAHYITKYGIIAPFIGFQPYVLSAWGSDLLLDVKGRLLGRVRKHYASNSIVNAKHVHTDGIKTKQAVIDLGAQEDRVSLSPFGIDANKFTPEKRSEELRCKLGIEGKTAVISLRTLEPIYDVQSLIKAVPLVISKKPDVRFLILGGGSLRQELESLARELGVSDYVNFVGPVPLDQMPIYLASSDIYVSTSLSDAGLAVSTCEAMACETPVVITDVSDNRLWVEDGVNGFIIPTSNPQALAKKILFLAKDEELRQTFGNRGRTIIIMSNDYYTEMKKIMDMYERIVLESSG